MSGLCHDRGFHGSCWKKQFTLAGKSRIAGYILIFILFRFGFPVATYIINANTFGAFYRSVGQTGQNDRVDINVGSNFSGTITVNSVPADGEIETVNLNLPDGWSVVLQSQTNYRSENPPYVDYAYTIVRGNGTQVGTLTMRGNVQMGDFFPCFAAGTLIALADGSRRACEDLRVGDMVATLDHGAQPVRWIGKRHLGPLDLARSGNLRPIRIRAGVLMRDLPDQDLLVSPQHRVLVSSAYAAQMFGARETLIAAKHLTAIDGIEIAHDLVSVSYYHLLFDRHEVIFSNGAATKSLFTGEQALKGVGEAARAEIMDLFPELSDGSAMSAARPFVTGRQGRALADYHLKSALPLSRQGASAPHHR